MAKGYTLPSSARKAAQRGGRAASMAGRAWKATRKLKTMLPMLQSYARTVLRDDSIMVGTTHQASYTDGKNLYIQPPMILGEDHVHKVGSCGIRGDDVRQICPACDANEITMALLYHEISHVLFGSFVKPNSRGRNHMAALVAEWHPPQACDHGIEILEAMGKSNSYFLIAGIFDPRLPLAMNAIEDARVNKSMLTARPGTEPMFDARMHQMFTSDSEQGDGTTKPWRELPVDAQVSIGMLLAASGYHLHLDVFHEEAKAILDDDVLVDLAKKIGKCKDVHELVKHACDMWRRFQDLGIMVKEKCVPPPPEDQDDKDENPDEAPESPDEDESPGLPGQDGDGGSSSTENDTEGGGKDDGDSSAGNQPERDPTAGGGSGSSPGSGAPESSGSNDQQDRSQGDMSELPDDANADSAGSGDRVQDERGSGDQDDPSSEEGSGGNGDPSGEGADGGDAGGDEPGEGEGASGEELTDGDEASEESQSQSGQGEVEDGERSDAEPEGGEGDPSGVPDGESDADGEEAGESGDSSDNFDADSDADSDAAEPGSPEEEGDGADFTPATVEQLIQAIQAASLHGLFGDDATDNFAGGHGLLNKEAIDATEEAWALALMAAAGQAMWFEGPSEEVGTVHVIEYGENGGIAGFNDANIGKADLRPSQEIVGPIVTRGRIAFSPNKRNRHENGLKSGRLNPRALRKIPLGEEALFRKKNISAKRSYHVIITMDVSGSTDSEAPSEHYPDQTTLQMIQRSVFAQAEALSRLNISFEIWAHTAYWFLTRQEELSARGSMYGMRPMDVWLLQVKTATDKWDDQARQRLNTLRPLGGNLDGHTLQIMRKKADAVSRKFTDVIICYYTDGAMPAANYREEASILREETALCKQKGYHLIAVGAGTESPKEWGFDTVQIDSDNDFPKVMQQLERNIL